MYAFLKVHGLPFNAPEPEVVLTMQALAAGEVPEVELAAWLKKYT
jgi:prophage maintenance system killer protein